MDSAVQPILCCLGQAVGECPTQYLMELSFAHQHLDWRAITVEVGPDELRAAIEGARAMGFRGLRFFGEMQLLAAETLGLTGLPVSSALAVKSGWQAWHTDGLVLPDLVEEQLNNAEASHHASPLTIALFGDSPLTRRVYAGLLNGYALDSGDKTETQVTWIGVPNDVVTAASQLRVLDTEQELLSELSGENANSPVCLVGCPYQVAQALSSIDRATPVSALQTRTSDRKESDHTTTPEPLESTEITLRRWVFWLPSSDDVPSETNAEMTAQGITRICHADLLLRGEQFDFARWTSHSISLAMLRDAYDEFNAF